MLFEAQNGERNCIKPGLLLYCRGISIYLLANQCTSLGIVIDAKTIVHGHPNKKNILSSNIKANEKQALLRGLIL